MGTLNDVVVIGHSVLVMITMQSMLQDYKLTDCQAGKYCSPASTDESHLATILAVRKDKESQDSSVKCICCRVSTKGFLYATFTALALLHVAFSVASVLVKRSVLNFSKCSWIYFILIIGTVCNALLITRLFNFDTKPVSKESALWTVLAMPFRLVWKTISSLFLFFLYQVLLKPIGLCNWYGQEEREEVDKRLYLCSLSDHDMQTATRLNPEYGLAVLSWTYVVTSVLTLHTLINSMNEEHILQEQMDKQDKKKEACGLCTQLNNNKRKDSIDDVEYERFDEDSFVLGWRL